MLYGQCHTNPATNTVTREAESVVPQLMHQLNGVKRILFEVTPVCRVLAVTTPATLYDDHLVMLLSNF